jgi:serine/threonine-protein kinase
VWYGDLAMQATSLSRDSILEQLARILSSQLFEGAGRSRALLKYAVEETVGGRANQLKEYAIGAEALGRGDSFDPRVDPIVRAEASRLRVRLERYYTAEGQTDPILITMPKGSYVPQFLERSAPAQASAPQPAAKPAFLTRRFLRIATGVFIALCALAFILWGPRYWRRPPRQQLIQFDVELKSRGVLDSEVGTDVIISRDGTRLVFVSRSPDGTAHLNTRRLDESQVTELAGTEGARGPFFSPDGEWVGFWAEGKLKKTPVEGGSPVILCDATDLLGGSWGEDGNIVAALGGGKLWRISSSGGPPVSVLDLTKESADPRWPQVLSNGNVVLFTAVGAADTNGATIQALSLLTGKRTVLARGGTFGRYSSSGYLTYVNQGTLFAVPFDLDRLQIGAVAIPVLDHVSYSLGFGFAQLDFSRTGELVYQKDTREQAVVELRDRAGRMQPLITKPGHYIWPRLSPDGQRLALWGEESGASGVWIYEDHSDHASQLALPAGRYIPLWTRDGRFLIVGGPGGLVWIRSDGSGKAEPLTQSIKVQIPWSLSPDGSRLAYHELSPATGFDLWTVPIHASEAGIAAGKPEPFLQTAAFETYPSFSPDGKWIAYGSNESGSWQVYVRAFPDRGVKVQVSTGGGRIPFWSPNHRELLFRTDDQRIMVASYATKGGSFAVQTVRPWGSAWLADTSVLANLDLAADGNKFVLLVPATKPENQQTGNHVTFILNFFDNVQHRIPSNAQ